MKKTSEYKLRKRIKELEFKLAATRMERKEYKDVLLTLVNEALECSDNSYIKPKFILSLMRQKFFKVTH